MNSKTPLTYDQAGVNYDVIDPLKISAQQAAASTAHLLTPHGFHEVAASRGESAYVVDVGPFYMATIVECLGSKALVADAMNELTGECFYEAIAQDTIAMAVNDLITVGATPLIIQAYWAAGGSDWFKNDVRAQALTKGWKAACERSGAAWGGGETPALAGIVADGRIDLAAGCTGIVQPKSRLSLGDHLGAGDAIIFLEASGIHANGVSLARKLAERLPQGYLTPIDDNGTSFGTALLAPTVLYAPVTEALAQAGIAVHYSVNVTGHGWRKLLRHPNTDLAYRINHIPPVPRVLSFMAEQAGLDDREAYATFNMGAGFALFVPADQAQATVDVAQACGIAAWHAGEVIAAPKALDIVPLNLRFSPDDLHVR